VARLDADLRNEIRTAVAQAASLRKGFHFREARELLEQARQRLEPTGPDDLRRQVDQGLADLDLAEHLDAARVKAATARRQQFDLARVELLYVSAFAEAGLGREADDVEAVAANVQKSAVSEEVIAALDDWAAVTRDCPRREWLLAVARKADPDIARIRLRQPDLWNDGKQLANLPEDLKVAALSPEMATALGRVLRLKDMDAVPLLTAAQKRARQDFRLNLELGLALDQGGRSQEAVGHLRAALAVRPESSAAHNGLGTALFNLGRRKEAGEHFEEALQLDPRSEVAHQNLGVVLQVQGRLDEAIGHFKQALSIDPDFAWAHANLGTALGKKELLDEAIDHFEQALRLDPKIAAVCHRNLGTALVGQGRAHAGRRDWTQAADCYARAMTRGLTDDGQFWFEYAALLLLSGDRLGYVKACAHLVDRCAKDKGPRSYHVARACTLAPGAVADMSLPSRLAEKELQGSREFWSLTEQGALAYRAGRFQEAVPLFEQSLLANPKPGAAVLNWLWLALAHHSLGKAEEARRWLGKAQAWLDQYGDGMPPRADSEVGLQLHNWLEAHVLRREAETVLASMP
jgi:tetratricopeptide (TPR) repeat protein